MTVDYARRFFRVSVLYALLGMAGGIYMAASHDHTLHPAHAHLLLLGWVGMTIFGVFHKLYPAAGAAKLAAWQFWFANAGVVLMIPGIAIIVSGRPDIGDPFAAVGSLLTIAAMAKFAGMVFRATR